MEKPFEIYQVDAFCKNLFSGNPAGVCPLESWPDDNVLQDIAAEKNLAETAFFVKNGDTYHIRWFTPVIEVDLCGHATMAAAHVLFNHKNYKGETITFTSRSGELTVTRENEELTLNFPVDEYNPIIITNEIIQCFSMSPIEAYEGKTDYMLVFSTEFDIVNIGAKLSEI